MPSLNRAPLNIRVDKDVQAKRDVPLRIRQSIGKIDKTGYAFFIPPELSLEPVTRYQRLLRLLRPMLITAALGGIGALINYLLLSPLPAPVLYLSGLFYLPVLIRYGIGYAIFCATLTQLPLLISQYWWLPFPELLALGWLIHKRKQPPMRAALLYWLTLGLTLTAAISLQVEGWNTATRLLALATPPLAGLVLMALTQHTIAVFRRRRSIESAPITQQLGSLLVVFACVPVLAFHVIGTPAYTREQLSKTLRTLEHAEHIAHERYELLVERNLRGLETISEMIATRSDMPLSSFEPLLNRVVGNLQEVFTIIIIDQDGYARAGAPDTFPDGIRVADAKQYYGDRDYFPEAKADPKPAVSYGIVGRRMNQEPLLSLAAPIVDEKQTFKGVVLGNLPLRRLQSVFSSVEHPERLDALIYDRKQQILFTTSDWQVETLSPATKLDFFPKTTTRNPPAELVIGDDLRPYLWNGKLIRHSNNRLGGGMVLIFDLLPDIYTLAFNSLLTLLAMIGSILAARSLAQLYGKRLLAPLLDLHKHLIEMDPARLHRMQPLMIESSTREVTELIRSVNTMMIRMAKSRLEIDWAIAEKDKLNADLDRKIAERTEELANKAIELERLSITDALTELFNRRHLTAELQHEWERSARTGSRFAVMLFDVDHFKTINDRYGHPVGDEVLRLIGRCLQEKIRGIDLAARYGGEEFAVLLPGIDASHALVVAERLRLALADQTLESAEGVLQFTVSIGICDSQSSGMQHEDELLQRVDQALYQAKRNGRNRSVVWSSSPAVA